MKRFVCIALLSFLCLLSACGPKPWGYEERVDLSKRPQWVRKPETEYTKTLFAFVGVSAKYTDESSARADARLRAYEEATEKLGTSVSEEIAKVLSEAGLREQLITPAQAKDQVTQQISQGTFTAHVKEYFVERYQLHQGQSRRYYYITYALLMVPRDLVDQAISKILDQTSVGEVDKESIARARRLLEERKARP